MSLASKKGGAVAPIKKFQPLGRLTRIGRKAAHPTIPTYKTKLPRRRRKNRRAKKAWARIIRLPRRYLFFKKNLLFTRRRSTRGFKENLLDKLTTRRGATPYIYRRVSTRLRRSSPLRRSLRRLLAKRD